MKKHLLALSTLTALTLNSNAQNGNASSNANAQWRITGNNASTTDFIGTTNNQSLILKTNNVQRVIFDTQGKTIFDGGGEVIIHPGGLHRPIPTNPIAAYMLQVGGSGIFDGELNSRQLFVEEYITFMKSLKGPAINVDSIKMDSTRGIYGHTKVVGDLNVKQNLTVEGDAIFKQDLYAQTVKVGSLSDNLDISVQTAPNGAKIMGFGYKGGPIPVGVNSCVAPAAGVSFNFPDRSVITTAVATDPVFDFRNTSTNGTIDYGFDYIKYPNNAERVGLSNVPSIKINGSCYGDVELAKGGGFVSTGKWFEVGSPVSSYKIASNIFGHSEIGQRIILNSPIPDGTTASGIPTYYNTQLFVSKDDTKALAVFNTKSNSNGIEIFNVYGDGKTQINAGIKTKKYFVINEASTATPYEALAINGSGYIQFNTPNSTAQPTNVIDVHDITNNKDLFRVKSNGHVYAREVEILNLTMGFPDYVFAKDYKLLSLTEVESYINKNKHLPGFEKAEYYESNGIKSSEMFVKQQEKIEELTLYIIELEKRLKAIEVSNSR